MYPKEREFLSPPLTYLILDNRRQVTRYVWIYVYVCVCVYIYTSDEHQTRP